MSTSDIKGRKSFFGGIAVLTASTAAVKIIGVFYKIPLIHMVGINGMAFFLAAYHIYTLLFTISTAGLPIAVSILVSRSRADRNTCNVERIYKVSLVLFSAIGGLCTLLLLLLADQIASIIEIGGAVSCIRAVAPSLFFTAVGSAVKGYCQGHNDMKPTAVSQVIEAVGKLVLGLVFANIALRLGLPSEMTAAYAIFGLTVGAAISTVYLFIVKRIKYYPVNGTHEKKKIGSIIRDLTALSAPITLSAVVISLTSIIDTALISSRLQSAGFSELLANTVYSSYGNLSIPLFNLVPAFITPIAMSMAPMLTEAYRKGNHGREKEILTSAFRLCGIVTIPASLGLAVFGKEILTLIFTKQTDAVNVSAPLLSVLAPAVLFSCLITITNAALQAYGKATKPIISMAVGALLKIIIEYVLVGVPEVNIFGAPISTVACDLVIVILNVYFVKKYTSGTLGLTKLFTKPLIAGTVATVISAGVLLVLKRFGIMGDYSILLVILTDIMIFALFAVKTNAVTFFDISLLPNGEKIGNRLRKIKLIK